MGQKKSGAGAKANFNRAIQSGHNSVNGGGNKAQGQFQSSGVKSGSVSHGFGAQSNANAGGFLGSAAHSASSLNTSSGYYSSTSQGKSQLSGIINQIISLISQLLKALGQQGGGQGNGGYNCGGGTGGGNPGHPTTGTPPKGTPPKKTPPKGCPPKGCPPRKSPPKGCPPKIDRPKAGNQNNNSRSLFGSNGITGVGGLAHRLTGIPLSPVALDLNGDGKIGVTGATSSIDKDAGAAIGKTVQFDLNADGVKENTEWFDGSGDGILVDTTKIGANGDLDGSALFGDEGGKFENGYDKLATRDNNNDGQISGAELDNLALWKDDGDAVLEAGELVSAKDANISSISSDMKITLGADGKSHMQSTATTTDGKQILSEDVWFAQK